MASLFKAEQGGSLGMNRECSYSSLGSEHLQKRKHLGWVWREGEGCGEMPGQKPAAAPATSSLEEEDPVSSLKSP